jgi:hypothetical protein
MEKHRNPVIRKSVVAGFADVGGVYWKIAEAPQGPPFAGADKGFVVRLLSHTKTTRFAVVPFGMASNVRKPPNQEPAVADVELLKVADPPEAGM